MEEIKERLSDVDYASSKSSGGARHFNNKFSIEQSIDLSKSEEIREEP